jgi:hypothetical protein
LANLKQTRGGAYSVTEDSWADEYQNSIAKATIAWTPLSTTVSFQF